MNDLLEFHGYQISTTAYGIDAIAIARGTRPDLILLDLQLPDISGFEVAGRLKADEATRATPIIAVTAFAMQGDEQKALASGCDAYIAKPINVLDFLRTVGTFLGSS